MKAFDQMIHLSDDATQDGWLHGFEYLLRQGRHLPPALTHEELKQAYEENAGLFVRCFLSAKVNQHRKEYGHKDTPHIVQLLAQAFSLDEHDVIDTASELPFHHVEESDVMSDPRLAHLTVQQTEAVQRFILAWFMQDAGYILPKKVIRQLHKDRQITGLPLQLKRGRQS